MPRLTTDELHKLARVMFADHESLPAFNLYYEIMQDLIPSEPPQEDDDDDFTPNFFAGLVFTGSYAAFLSFGYSSDGVRPEEIDVIAQIEALPGIAVSDNEKLQLISESTARTIAGIAFRSTDGVVVSRLYRHPGIDKKEAIGYLKAAIDGAEQPETEEDASS